MESFFIVSIQRSMNARILLIILIEALAGLLSELALLDHLIEKRDRLENLHVGEVPGRAEVVRMARGN